MSELQAQKREVTMTFPYFDAPCLVEADRTRLKQVLINLLSNAIKYGRAGGTVAVEYAVCEGETVRVSVRDNGKGLSLEKQAQLFQPFNRLGQELSTVQGTGIGLVMSKRLVELMGGRIGVESGVGEGSVFWFELKLAGDERAQPIPLAPVSIVIAEQFSALPKARTILYVEDNPANLKLVERLLERRTDIRLLSARDGGVGVQLARTHRPDVILMDINLPGISGIEALRILREDPATAGIPVVALSANAMPRDVEKGMEAGFFRYLTKPIQLGELMETLDVALALGTGENLPLEVVS